VTLLPVLFPGVDNSLRYEVVQLAAFTVLAVVLLAATRGRLGRQGRSAAPRMRGRSPVGYPHGS
jgi:hypothetical protein